MIKDILSPDDIAAFFNNPFVAAYWPLLFGGPVVFLFLVKGYNWIAIPLGALTLLGQAWHFGMLA